MKTTNIIIAHVTNKDITTLLINGGYNVHPSVVIGTIMAGKGGDDSFTIHINKDKIITKPTAQELETLMTAGVETVEFDELVKQFKPEDESPFKSLFDIMDNIMKERCEQDQAGSGLTQGKPEEDTTSKPIEKPTTSEVAEDINESFFKNKHRTHYLKWEIGNGTSIRYFFLYEDKPKLEGKWVIKNHDDKKFQIFENKQIAMSMIRSLCPSTKALEITGIRKHDMYIKTIMDENGVLIKKEEQKC